MNGEKALKTLEKNWAIVILTIIIVVSLGLLYYVLFVNTRMLHYFNGSPTQKTKKISTLDNNLDSIVRAENNKEALRLANQNNLAVSPDSKYVMVVITLKNDSFVFLPVYGTQQIRYGRYIQAYVKLDKLKDLAKNPNIIKISSVQEATQQPPTGAPVIISPASSQPQPTVTLTP